MSGMKKTDDMKTSGSEDTSSFHTNDDDETIDEPPPPTTQPSTELIERGHTSNRAQSTHCSSEPSNPKDEKSPTGTTRPGAVHVYPSGSSENNISTAAGRFAQTSTEDQSQNIERGALSRNVHESRGSLSGLCVDTAAGWSVDGVSVPTRPSLAHANQSFRSYMEESSALPPPTISSLSSRSFFSRQRRLILEEAARQHGDEIARQHAANMFSTEHPIAAVEHFQEGAYVTHATPVPTEESNGVRNQKRGFCDWRVLFLLLLIAIATISGMVVTMVLKSRKETSSNPAGLSTGSITDEQDSSNKGDTFIVPMPLFSMEMTTTDGSMDHDLLLSVTTSHLSAPMQDEIVNFEGLELNITIQHDRSTILSNIYPASRIKGKSDPMFASFEGIIKLEDGSSSPSQKEIETILDGAFSGPDLDLFVVALEDVGIIASLVVSDKFGVTIGSSELGDTGTTTTTGPATVTQQPTQLPTANNETTTEVTFPSSSPESIHPTAAPVVDPTEEPVVASTHAPTVLPTAGTEAPTRTPFLPPSKSPTNEPTSSPSHSPTDKPTDRPTDKPTFLPSASPTGEPTGEPTSPPSKTPTVEPTLAPTPLPTMPPSVSPTSREPISFKIESQPGFLTTRMENKFSRSGAMFDVEAKEKAVKITSLDLHIESSNVNIPVEVWVKLKTYIGFEQYSRVWTQLNNGNPYVIPRGYGSGRLTPIPEEAFDPIHVAPGTSLGIYVTLQSRKGMLFGNGNYASEDEYVRIESGASVGYRFDSPMNRDRTWSGAIRYAVE